MKVLVACLLLTFLGVTIASPAPSLPTYYSQHYKNWFDTKKVAQEQSKLRDYVTDYVFRKLSGGSNKQTSSDKVAALMESLLNDQHYPEPEEDDDSAALQSLLKVLAKVEEEKAKEMDSKSVRAQFLTGLGSTLLNAGRDYLVDRYCPMQENPTES